MEPFAYSAPPQFFRVGGVTLDTVSRIVTVDGQPQPIETKPLEMFIALLSRGGEGLSRAELKTAGWGIAGTADGSLDEAISRLRRKLGRRGSDIVVLAKVGGQAGYQIGLPVETWTTAFAPKLALNFSPGDRIPSRPGWRLGRSLSPSGRAWRAVSDNDGTAVTFLFADTADRVAMLQHESECSQRLWQVSGGFENWLPVMDRNFDSAPHFIVRPFRETSLAAFALTGGLHSLPLDARVSIVAVVARCVAAARSVGVFHGALRAERVFIDRDGQDSLRVWVAGFVGTDKILLAESQTSSSNRTPYLPPEGGAGGSVTGDVYALAVLLFQAVKGDCTVALGAGGTTDISDPLLREDIEAAGADDPASRITAAELANRLEQLADRRETARHNGLLRGQQEVSARRRATNARRVRLAGSVGLAVMVTLAVAMVLTRRGRQFAAVQSERVAQITETVKVADANFIDGMADGLAGKAAVPLPFLLETLNRSQATLLRIISIAPDDAYLLRLEARALAEFAKAYYFQGALTQGQEAGMRASAIQRKLLILSPKDAGLLSDLAYSERWLGEIYLEQHDLDHALSVSNDVFRISAGLAAASPTSLEAQLQLGRAEDAVGLVQMMAGNNDLALSTFGSSQAILDKAMSQRPEDTEGMFTSAVNETRTGDALELLGEWQAALDVYRKSEATFRQLVARDGSNKLWRRDLGMAEADIGDELYKLNDVKSALVAYLAAVAGAQELVDSDPTNAIWQRDEVVGFTDIGDAKEELGDFPGAVSAYQSAETLLAALVVRAPDDLSLRHDFVGTELNLAEVLIRKGDRVAAAPLVAQSLQQAQRMLAAHPKDATLVHLLQLVIDLAKRLEP